MLLLIGGGQLARMSILAAKKLGIPTAVLTDKEDSPALDVADCPFLGSYTDQSLLERVARCSTSAIVEFENVPLTTLQTLARLNVDCSPTPTMLAYSKNRILEKGLARELHIPTVDLEVILTRADLFGRQNDYERLLPGVLKTAEGGYDGKLQERVADWNELCNAYEKFCNQPCILEQFVEFDCELSEIGVRDHKGCRIFYPLVMNRHQDGVLATTTYKPRLFSEDLGQLARDYVLRLMEFSKHWGILAVEFFLTKDGHLLFNEMAPRPHNSGHWTIDGCETSQFEAIVRVAVGMPLKHIEPVNCRVVMKNLFGDEVLQTEQYERDGWRIHDYGKRQLTPGRKTGHITKVGVTKTCYR